MFLWRAIQRDVGRAEPVSCGLERGRAARWLTVFALTVLALGTSACGGDAVLTLGSGDPSPTFGDAGQRVRNVNDADYNELGATLTEDLLEIFFASDRAGGVGSMDVWYATRRSRVDPFDPPALVLAASSSSEEQSPAISADGLTLWFASAREGGKGGLDIWRITRLGRGAAWGALENVTALNSAQDDVPRPPGEGSSSMPIASTRAGGGLYQTFLARRDGPELDFSTIEPLDYLWTADASMEAACLTDDGLFLFFRRAEPGKGGDLYLAWRTSTLERFRDPIALSAINSPDDERDPFLSADRFRFFFSSSRRDSRELDIYATNVELPTYE
jgi:WD40-like Beta Propeller Repeat